MGKVSSVLRGSRPGGIAVMPKWEIAHEEVIGAFVKESAAMFALNRAFFSQVEETIGSEGFVFFLDKEDHLRIVTQFTDSPHFERSFMWLQQHTNNTHNLTWIDAPGEVREVEW